MHSCRPHTGKEAHTNFRTCRMTYKQPARVQPLPTQTSTHKQKHVHTRNYAIHAQHKHSTCDTKHKHAHAHTAHGQHANTHIHTYISAHTQTSTCAVLSWGVSLSETSEVASSSQARRVCFELARGMSRPCPLTYPCKQTTRSTEKRSIHTTHQRTEQKHGTLRAENKCLKTRADEKTEPQARGWCEN